MTIPPAATDAAASEQRPPRFSRRARLATAVAAVAVAAVLTTATVLGVAAAGATDVAASTSRTARALPGCPARSSWVLGTVTNPRPGRFDISKSNGQDLTITTAPATRYYQQTHTAITPAAVGRYLLASGDAQSDGSFDAGVIGLSHPNHGCTPAEAFGATITMVTDSANVIAGTITAVHGSRLTVRTRDGLRDVQTAYASSITTDAATSASALSPGSVVMVASNRTGRADAVYVGAPAGLPEHN